MIEVGDMVEVKSIEELLSSGRRIDGFIYPHDGQVPFNISGMEVFCGKRALVQKIRENHLVLRWERSVIDTVADLNWYWQEWMLKRYG